MLIPFSLFRESVHPKTTHFSTIFSVYFNECLYVRKKFTPLPKQKSLAHCLIVENSACACPDCFTLAELIHLGQPKCLCGGKLAQLEGSPF